MHVLSIEQSRLLLKPHLTSSHTLLDVGMNTKSQNTERSGAGDGAVTENLAKLFDTVYATEVSAPMISQLSAKGFMLAQNL